MHHSALNSSTLITPLVWMFYGTSWIAVCVFCEFWDSLTLTLPSPDILLGSTDVLVPWIYVYGCSCLNAPDLDTLNDCEFSWSALNCSRTLSFLRLGDPLLWRPPSCDVFTEAVKSVILLGTLIAASLFYERSEPKSFTREPPLAMMWAIF
jgi:hypothetical protein